MKTVAACIEQLKNDLQKIDDGNLDENYNKLTRNEETIDDSLYVKWACDEVYSQKNRSLPLVKACLNFCKLHGNENSFSRYSDGALQAAKNVALILEEINGEGSLIGIVAGTIKNITWKGKKDNLLTSLHYLDMAEGHGVAYVIDDKTLKINQAIVKFIENLDTVKAGKTLISWSELLKSLSFGNMKIAASERIKNYEAYQQALLEQNRTVFIQKNDEQNNGESSQKVRSTAQSDELDDEFKFLDARETEEDDDYYDCNSEAKNSNHSPLVIVSLGQTEPQPLGSGKSFSNNASLIEDANINDAADPEKIAFKEIMESFDTFYGTVFKNLESRLANNTDDKQKKRCQSIMMKLTEMFIEFQKPDYKVSSISNYLETDKPELESVFLQNRSQTWFRVYIAEPFAAFIRAVNRVLQGLGMASLPEPTTTSFEQFKIFKQSIQTIQTISNHKSDNQELTQARDPKQDLKEPSL
jgi:hypothetical protein